MNLYVFAELCLIPIGFGLRAYFVRRGVVSQLLWEGFLVLGILGAILDIIYASMIWVIGYFTPRIPGHYLIGLWNSVLIANYTSIWMTVIWCVVFALVAVLILKLIRKDKVFSKFFYGWGIAVVLAFIFGIISSFLTMTGKPSVIIDSLFILGGMVILPVWILWLGIILGKQCP